MTKLNQNFWDQIKSVLGQVIRENLGKCMHGFIRNVLDVYTISYLLFLIRQKLWFASGNTIIIDWAECF